MKMLHIACAQFSAVPQEKHANIARMAAYAQEARSVGCDLVLFPELIVTGYLLPPQIAPLAEPIDGPSVQKLAQIARDLGIAIAFGLAERNEQQDTCHNSLVVLDKSGQVIGLYRKMHLWGRENEWATPGRDMPAFEVNGVCCAGWICYDTRFPEVGRLAALRGTDLGLIATAWLGPQTEWELAVRARALDNSIFVAGADLINPHPDLRCLGASLIVGPKGNVLAQAKPGQEGIIHAVLDDALLVKQRQRVQLLQTRKPARYDQLGLCRPQE